MSDIPYSDGMTRSLVLDFFNLSVSERRSIAEWLDVRRTDLTERDFDYGRRVLLKARDDGKIGELAGRIALAKSHR